MTKSLAAAVISITLILGGGLAMAEISSQPSYEPEPAECVPSESETCEEESEGEVPETCETGESDDGTVEGASTGEVGADAPATCDEDACEPTDGESCEDDSQEVGEEESLDEVVTESKPDEGPAEVVVEDEWRNHGEAVSTAAEECPPGPEHGACVSAVAKSDAGKKAHGDDAGLSSGPDRGASKGKSPKG